MKQAVTRIEDQDTLDGAVANYASLRLKDLAMNPLKGNYHTPHFLHNIDIMAIHCYSLMVYKIGVCIRRLPICKPYKDGDKKLETRELRKNRDILMITGMGVLAFGLWNMIKVIMFFTLERKMISEMLISSIGSVEGSTDEEIKIIYRIAYVIFLMVILLVIAIDILIRLYIARCAVAEARGHKKGNMYLVFAGIMIVLSLLSMLYAFKGITPDPDKIIDTVSTFVVEITSFVTLTEMFAAVHRIR